MIAAQNVVPLINSDKASDEVKDVLNAVSKALTTEELLELNEKNQGDGQGGAGRAGQGVAHRQGADLASSHRGRRRSRSAAVNPSRRSSGEKE